MSSVFYIALVILSFNTIIKEANAILQPTSYDPQQSEKVDFLEKFGKKETSLPVPSPDIVTRYGLTEKYGGVYPEGLAISMTPRELCHEVKLCFVEKSTGFDASICEQQFLLFHTMEGTLIHSYQDRNNPNNVLTETYVYPDTTVFLEYEHNNEQYVFQARKYNPSTIEEPIVDKDPSATIAIDLKGQQYDIVVFTSSRHCDARIRVFFTMMGGQNELPMYTYIKKSDRFDPNKNEFDVLGPSVKMYTKLIPQTVILSQPSKSAENGCLPFSRIPLFYDQYWPEELPTDIAIDPIYTMYSFSLNSFCFPPSPQIIRMSFLLEVSNPENCQWIRLCIEDYKAQSLNSSLEMCADPKKSIEILLSNRLIVGMDSDRATELGVPLASFRVARIEINPNLKRLIFSYLFIDDETALINHKYHFDYPRNPNGTYDMKLIVSMIRAPECKARLMEDGIADEPTKGKPLDRNSCARLLYCAQREEKT